MAVARDAVEVARERQARRVTCPVCQAGPLAACNGDGWMQYSHTGRYDRAARVGLVPPLPGGVTHG